MRAISSADFSSTVAALTAYSRSQMFSESARAIFILKREGNKLLFIETDSLSTIQKIIRFFGFGGYKLCDFENLLQSEEFCNTLKETPLNAQTRTKCKKTNPATQNQSQKPWQKSYKSGKI